MRRCARVAQLREALRRETFRRQAAEVEASAHAQSARYEAERSAINEQRQSDAIAAFEAMRNSTSWRITAPLRRVRSPRNLAGPQITQAPAPVEAQHAPGDSFTPGRPSRGPGAPSVPPAYRTTVHQFHSGAATADAITNSMLITRTRLRAMGYDSDIFVTFRDEALAQELRLTEELPRHEHYVLILHHSMGFDTFKEVTALAAPKVLLYHNITPAGLLQGDEFMQTYAAIGREQLKALRGAVCAALAESEFNAIELRTLGFSSVQVCQTLVDMDALRARAAAAAAVKDSSLLTILFVGRVVRSKGQLELVDVFEAFRNAYGKPCRLVLVGRHGGPGDAYLQSLETRIAAGQFGDDVILTGVVSDDALHDWYRRADIYLSLSHHEGFGVPLVEAMAHGLPVLARAAGAVPYTLGQSSGLLHDASTDAVVGRLLDLAQSDEERAALVRRQHASLERFRWADNKPVLVQALAAAGAVPPLDDETRVALGAAMQFTVAGHVNGSYSLAMINRTLATAIEATRPGTVRLLAVEGEPTTDISGVPQSDAAGVAQLVERPVPVTGPHVVISQHYPLFVPREPCDLALAYFFWEESVVPPETIACLNRSFGGVLAPSRFVAKTLVDSGLSIPVRVVGFAPHLERFRDVARNRDVAGARPFTFLHVSSGFPRKGVDSLLEAFRRAFRQTDAVRLVIKAFPNPHNDVAETISSLQREDQDSPEIILIDRDIDEEALLDLYRDADVMVLPTRGEGLNLPAAEAMAAGLPVIVTGFGGHMDFCADTARLIDYCFAPSGSHLAVAGSLWVEPDLADLTRALSRAHWDRLGTTPSAALPDARTFTQAIVAAATDLLVLPPLQRPLRIGWVSSWGVRCGVAEYSRHLVGALSASMDPAEITVFCDNRSPQVTAKLRDVSVLPCWTLELADGARPLVRAVAAEDPDVLVIQHQPGLIGWPALAELVSAARVAARPVVLVLHSPQGILDIEEDERGHLIDALRRVTRVIVHTVNDLNRLKDLGLVANTAMIPQGASGSHQPSAATSPDRRAITIGCYGFFLPHKGVPQLIEAVARLRSESDIRLRLVNADYGSHESAEEIARCRELAEAAGMAHRIEWHTDFMADQESLRHLAGCDLVVLPYQRSKEGSSAALRMALTSGAPVAVTPVPLFEEAEQAVYRFEGTDSAAIAAGLEYLLARPQGLQALREEAQQWLAPRRWPVIATRFGGMLRGLHGGRRPL